MKYIFLSFALLLAVAGFAADRGTNELSDAGFENLDSGVWEGFQAGFTVDRTDRHSGEIALRLDRGTAGEQDTGVWQTIRYEQPDTRPIFAAGWSRTDGLAGSEGCLYLDIFYEDGSATYGVSAAWSGMTPDWEYTALYFEPPQPVREIHYCILLRRGAGRIQVDDFELSRDVPAEQGGIIPTRLQVVSDRPRSGGWLVQAELTGYCGDWDGELLRQGSPLAVYRGSGREIRFLHRPAPAEPRPDELRITTARDGRTERFHYRFPERIPGEETVPDLPEASWWIQPATEKVYPGALPPAEPCHKIDVALAGNERENVQIALRLPNAESREIAVKVNPLQHDSGTAVIPADNLRIALAANVWNALPTKNPLVEEAQYPAWTPEILIPQRSFRLPGGLTQTVWLEIAVPAGQAPGCYRGVLELESARPDAAIVIPIEVEVFDFALPVRPSLRTAFAQMDSFTRCVYPEITPELRRKMLDIMLDYRLNPTDISRINPPEPADLQYADKRGMNAFCVANLVTPIRAGENQLWKCFSPLSDYDDAFFEELPRRLDDFVAWLDHSGLEAQGYVYGFDERPLSYESALKRTFGFIKQRYPNLKTFTTAIGFYRQMADKPDDYQDYIDWYCPLTSGYDLELSRRLRRLGKEVWWYVMLGPYYPYANFAMLDHPSIEGRLLPWQTWQFESDGLLFWHVNLGWHLAENRPISAWQPFCDWNTGFSGDGNLIYPAPDGPLPGIRLVNLRDGSEDYEYLTIYAALKGREAALAFAERLSRSLTDFSRDPALLESVRRELGHAIEQANREKAFSGK